MMNKKGFINIVLPIILIFIALVVALAFTFSTKVRLTIVGAVIIIATLIYIIPGLMQGEVTNKKIVIVLLILVTGIGFILAGNAGLFEQVTLAETFTPVYCSQPEFICCVDDVKQINGGGMSKTDSYMCPNTANYCDIKSFTFKNSPGDRNYLTHGKTSCVIGSHVLQCLGDCFACTDGSPAYAGHRLMPGEYIYIYNDNTLALTSYVIEEHKNALVKTGTSSGTNGVAVPGAEGCTFNPETQRNGDGTIIKSEATGTSYVVQTGATGCILSWPKSRRTICANFEEQCKTDADCIGHTYGNKECQDGRLITYGCNKVGAIPSDLVKEGGDYVDYLDEGESNPTDTTLTRCDPISTTVVQCCGDTDCGTNAVCDPITWTCKAPSNVVCSQSSDCGVSVVCDFNAKLLKTPTCTSNKCGYDTKAVECCNNNNCASDWFCDVDYKCKQSNIPKIDCPNSCCVGESKYFDKPCTDGKFCVNGLCNLQGCENDDDCLDGKVCNEGNCVTKDDKETLCVVKAEEHPLLGYEYVTTEECGLTCKMKLSKPTTTGTCKATFLVWWIVGGLGLVFLILIFALLFTGRNQNNNQPQPGWYNPQYYMPKPRRKK